MLGGFRDSRYLCGGGWFSARKTHTCTFNPKTGQKCHVQGGANPSVDLPRGPRNGRPYIPTSMATGSKAGACSSNTKGAKANCLAHNRRDGRTPSYVNPHLTHTNRTVFEADSIRDIKRLTTLTRRAEQEYTAKTGQKCQKSFTPLRESALVIRPGVTDEQLKDFARRCEAMTGWKCLGIWVHNDEGHPKSKFVEGEEGFAINHHAHVLWDCQDHQTGKIKRPVRNYFSKMQDLLAAATGMERGTPARETGRRHREAAEQRILAQEQRIEKLIKLAVDGEKTVETMDKQLQKVVGSSKTLGRTADRPGLRMADLANLQELVKARHEVGDGAQHLGRVRRGTRNDRYGSTAITATVGGQEQTGAYKDDWQRLVDFGLATLRDVGVWVFRDLLMDFARGLEDGMKDDRRGGRGR